ncbi:MAG: c-type cytochrome biogenesis protein CcsB [Thermoleophilia bacterium]
MTAAAEQIIAVWISEALYGVATVLLVLGFAFRSHAWIRTSFLVALGALVPHTAAILMRWNETGHAPYIQFYEVILSDTWFGVVIFLVLVWRYPRLRPAGLLALPLTFILLGIAVLSSTEIRTLPPTFQTYWLILHILFAKFTYGSFLVAADLGLLYVLKERFLVARGFDVRTSPRVVEVAPEGLTVESALEDSFYRRLPGLARLDELSYQFAVAGFLFCGTMIAAGAVWANNAWGEYWGWDPVETWSLVTWLVYGIFLHLRMRRGWKGSRSAWYLLGALALALAAFFVMPYIMESIHSAYLGKGFQQ